MDILQLANTMETFVSQLLLAVLQDEPNYSLQADREPLRGPGG
nr:L679 [uncultured bacterium]